MRREMRSDRKADCGSSQRICSSRCREHGHPRAFNIVRQVIYLSLDHQNAILTTYGPPIKPHVQPAYGIHLLVSKIPCLLVIHSRHFSPLSLKPRYHERAAMPQLCNTQG